MAEKRYVVGVDMGTTSTKTVVFNFEGEAMGYGQKLNPLIQLEIGRASCRERV